MARETHNFIIVDADPVVVEPFTSFAMLHSDAVIVIARAGVTIFQQLATALEEVRRQPVGALTALLNFAPDVSGVGVQHRIQIGIRSLSVMKRRFHFWLVRRRP